MATSQEIAPLMESLAEIDAATTEEEIYDRIPATERPPTTYKEREHIEAGLETLHVPFARDKDRKDTDSLRFRTEVPTQLYPAASARLQKKRTVLLLVLIMVALASVGFLLYEAYRLSRPLPQEWRKPEEKNIPHAERPPAADASPSRLFRIDGNLPCTMEKL